jgi:hypothetical protein
MKKLLSFLFLLALIGCSDLRRINNRIYEVQKQQLLQSPYKDAKRTIIKIDAQKQFRLNRLPVLIKDKIFHHKELTDTLLILEDFDEICSNCSSQRMQVLYQDTIYFFDRDLIGNKVIYKVQSERFDIASKDEYGYQFQYFELTEIKKK